MRDSGFGIRDSGFGIRDSGFGNRDSGIGNRESGKQTPLTLHRPRSLFTGPGFRVPTPLRILPRSIQ
ncbi:hypothetical protein EAT51_13305 [Pseudoxanthomonas winnipegensis]|nr:hypothetical protein EAT51_13305 [Pseudoxanthomonas winnipegensis]